MTTDAPVADAVADAANVLVLADGMSAERDAVCGDLLARRDAAATNAVAVLYNRSPDDWLEHLRDALGGAPANVHLVDTGGTRGTSVAQPESPEDLTGIEIAITDPLESFARSGETVLCFDSVTALLQYVDTERAYRFLHALTERLWRADVRSHFHLDPGAHDESTVATLTTLFDAVVATDPELLARTDARVDREGAEVGVARRPAFGPTGSA